MQAPVHYKIQQQNLWLSPERVIFWEEEKTLVLSDLHIGKTGHFRKSGIAVPAAVLKNDLQRLFHQVQHFQPGKLVVVGDFFHSSANKELDFFLKWRNDHPSLDIILVKGNHDILDTTWYEQAGITVCNDQLHMHEFCFVHDVNDVRSLPGCYAFSGHIHPGIYIRGLGRQALRFPCFYFGEDYAVLPAFGGFTGVALIDPKENENVFALVEGSIIQIQ